MVEKSEIDMLGSFQNDNQVVSDIHFVGALRSYNVPLVRSANLKTSIDFLKLPFANDIKIDWITKYILN